MKKLWFLGLMVALIVGCSTNDPDSGNGGNTGNGSENNGGTENGGSDNSGSDNNNGDQDGSAPADSTSQGGNDSGEWTLLFEDDFESDANGNPNSEYWTLCVKGNDSWNRYQSESYSQAYIQDGYLNLVAEKSGDTYLTGGIETRSKFDFTYGKVEVRAKFEQGKGTHTGIWMMPESQGYGAWPRSGEIDIMEHLSKETKVWQTAHNWWAYKDGLNHPDDPKAQDEADFNPGEWNIYGLEWNDDSLTYTVNGTAGLVYPNKHFSGDEGNYQWPYNEPFYLILSISVGGEGTWAGPIDNSELPAKMFVDYVRVYQKAE